MLWECYTLAASASLLLVRGFETIYHLTYDRIWAQKANEKHILFGSVSVRLMRLENIFFYLLAY